MAGGRRGRLPAWWNGATRTAHRTRSSNGTSRSPRPAPASLGAFFVQHAAIFEPERSFAAVCESYTGDDDREVRLTVPYEAFADFDLTESVEPELDTLPAPAPADRFRPRAGRNQPCPCGSGRKYKKCHLAADEAEHASRQATAPAHALDDRLVNRLSRFARREFGAAWEAHADDFADPDEALQLARPWSVYCFEVAGKTVVDAYLDARGRCSNEERRWLEAQRAAWLSVWEVEAVDPGQTLTLHDLLSGERRTVRETRGSKTLVPRDALLARIVDHDGVSLLCGVHQRPLPPFDTAEVVRRAQGRLRRRRAVPVERLRDAALGRNLIRYWEEAVEGLDVRSAIPPEFRNRDGDPVLLTVDHFEVAPGAMTAIAARIAEMEDTYQEGPGEDAPVYVFLRPDDATRPNGEQTIIGRVRMDSTGRSGSRPTRGRGRTRCANGSRRRPAALASATARESTPTRAHSARDPGKRPAAGDGAASPEAGAPGGGAAGAPLRRLDRPAAAGAEPEDAAGVRAHRRRAETRSICC